MSAAAVKISIEIKIKSHINVFTINILKFSHIRIHIFKPFLVAFLVSDYKHVLLMTKVGCFNIEETLSSHTRNYSCPLFTCHFVTI